MDTITIVPLVTEEELIEAFPLMNQLRTHLNLEEYLELVYESGAKERYQMLGLRDKDVLKAVIGFKPMITLYYGRSLWVCDLVTDKQARSKGYGEKLLSHVEHWGKQHNYESIALSSGLQRTNAHHFYEGKMDYIKVSVVFKKEF
ncbi:GNAT family N-acetyltransferase [Sporosarcina aquimarina]|uniref:GNAT family N-acetyltransferase n=1 Tax=Sporosarcina aquimarina TaxID=114975 RepID=A0ABU4FXN3_9BACL|nr:GNAT family N-acetyltransferase [Sporosarcina aquimarina]MDW0109469.1 GNAT family N-acetyltransferase [Sporosarcina aquimarina]